MPRPPAQPALEGPEAFLRALRDPGRNAIETYREDPVGLAEKLYLRLPPKPIMVMRQLGNYDPEQHGPLVPGLRDLVQDVCSGNIESAAVVGPRGGGKSMGVAFIEFFLVFFKDYDALNLGGSELQADAVYQYIASFVETSAQFRAMVKGDMLQSFTKTVNEAWIRVLAASQKSVRSPHAGGRKPDGRLAGGILVIDEEAEAAPDIVSAALPTVNTARPSVNVRASTFHNNEGSFADLIENAEEMGYKVYSWDIFDVAERCACTGPLCQSTEKCFRADHYEDYIDPDTGEQTRKLLHKAYCGGRAMYAQGWIPMDEIVKLWKRIKRNHSVWEVEAMGSRPSSKGYVIRDQQRFKANIVKETGAELYMEGFAVDVCVDWGSVAAGVTVWQEQPGDKHALLYAELVEEAGLSQIIGIIIGLYYRWPNEFREVAADIGGGGNYLNPKLREEHGLPTRDVNFGEEKESAVAAWNIYNEGERTIIPEEFSDFITQVKQWRRKDGRIKKGKDHLCDASVCYFSKFVDRLGIRRVRTPPRSFSTSPQTGNNSHAPRSPGASHARPVGKRRAIVATPSRRRRP